MTVSERVEAQLRFCLEADKLKQILRVNLLADGSRRENDAEHSWHMALMVLTLGEYARPEADLCRAMKMALVHDMVEIDAGDTFAYDEAGKRTQAERERKAADRVFGLLPPDQAAEVRGLWEEFDARETPTALFAAAADTFQPLMNNYRTEGHTWKLGNVTADRVYARIEPLRRALPEVWPFADAMIRDSIAKGWLREAAHG